MRVQVGSVFYYLNSYGKGSCTYLYLGKRRDSNYPRVKGRYNQNMWLDITGLELNSDSILPIIKSDVLLSMDVQPYRHKVVREPDAKTQRLVAVIRGRLSEVV